MNKKNKTNGILDVETPEMKEMKKTVIEQELSARSWKAYYEKMYFSMEAEKLEPLYKEYQERIRKRLEEDKARFEEAIKRIEQEEKAKKETESIDREEPKLEVVK